MSSNRYREMGAYCRRIRYSSGNYMTYVRNTIFYLFLKKYSRAFTGQASFLPSNTMVSSPMVSLWESLLAEDSLWGLLWHGLTSWILFLLRLICLRWEETRYPARREMHSLPSCSEELFRNNWPGPLSSFGKKPVSCSGNILI